MQELQREDGIVLPSVDWALNDDDDDEHFEIGDTETKLRAMCERFPKTWGRAVREYGDFNLQNGIDQSLRHMDILLTHKDWRDCENVFAVVLTNLKHAAFDDNNNNNRDDGNVVIEVGGNGAAVRARRHNQVSAVAAQEHEQRQTIVYHEVQDGGEDEEDEDAQRSVSLLTTLREKLPYLYLHLHDLDVQVQGKPIESIYWERRLAELSMFELQISQTELWSKIRKARYSPSNVKSVYDIDNPSQIVRFFCGFDPYRCQNQWGAGGSTNAEDGKNNNEKDGNNHKINAMTSVPGGGMDSGGNNAAMKIYLYSRESGRLIKVQNDPRNEVGLSGGSTDYCQGLTVIVDDYNGTLPLNPTKQDTAYGHSKHGQTHAANVKEWTSAIAHFYWNYHYYRLGESKNAVRAAVLQTKSALEEAYRNYGRQQDNDCDDAIKVEPQNDDDGRNNRSTMKISPLCRGTFIKYDQVDFSLTGYRGFPSIRAVKRARENAVPTIAHNEVVRLDEEEAAIAIAKIANSAKKKRARGTIGDYNNHQVSQHVTSLEIVGSPTPKRLRSSHLNEAEIARLRDKNLNNNELLEIIEPNKGRSEARNPEVAARGSSNNNPQAPKMEIHRLRQQLQHCAYQNSLLQQNCDKMGNDAESLKRECAKLRASKTANQQEIYDLKVYRREAHGEIERLRAEVERLRAGTTNETAPGNYHGYPNPSALTAETNRLKRQLQVYKSRAEFYKRETESKKTQIENLAQEKTRFEDRVQELEAAQLNGYGGDMLQF